MHKHSLTISLSNRSDLERDSVHSSLVQRSRQFQLEHQQGQQEQSLTQTQPQNHGGGRVQPNLGRRQSSHEERHQQLLREANRRASQQYRRVSLWKYYSMATKITF